MKSAVCDDNDHDSCSGKFYKYDDTSSKKIMESCSCLCHYKSLDPSKSDGILRKRSNNIWAKKPKLDTF